MGKLANIEKERTCLVCNEMYFFTSGEMKAHAKACAARKRQPQVQVPRIVIDDHGGDDE
jgi:hypothetical protein